MKIILFYSVKLWLTVATVSLILLQLPLLYMRHFDFNVFNSDYSTIWFHFLHAWSNTTFVLAFSWILAFALVKAMYSHKWTKIKFKVVLFLISELLMLLSLVVFFSLNNLQYVIPTTWMFLIFSISYAISVGIYRYKGLHNELKLERQAME